MKKFWVAALVLVLVPAWLAAEKPYVQRVHSSQRPVKWDPTRNLDLMESFLKHPDYACSLAGADVDTVITFFPKLHWLSVRVFGDSVAYVAFTAEGASTPPVEYRLKLRPGEGINNPGGTIVDSLFIWWPWDDNYVEINGATAEPDTAE